MPVFRCLVCFLIIQGKKLSDMTHSLYIRLHLRRVFLFHGGCYFSGQEFGINDLKEMALIPKRTSQLYIIVKWS